MEMEIIAHERVKETITVMCKYRHWLNFLWHVMDADTISAAGLCLMYRHFKSGEVPEWALTACSTIKTSTEAVLDGADEKQILESMKDLILDDLAFEIMEVL